MALNLLARLPKVGQAVKAGNVGSKLSSAGSRLTSFGGKLLGGTTQTAVGGAGLGYGFANIEKWAEDAGFESDQTIRFAIFGFLALAVVYVVGQLFTVEI